jgi:tetratricopeptide (TPR) repeat protein
LSLAPNAALVLLLHNWNRLYAGDWRTALVEVERAMRLSPVDPAIFYFTIVMCGAQFVAGHHAEAADWARRTLRLRPGYLIAHRLLAASLVGLGERDAAREAVRALLAFAPGDTIAWIAAHSALRGEARERYLAALREAGLPD